MQQLIYNSEDLSTDVLPQDQIQAYRTLKIESYVLSGFYLLIAVIAYAKFFHHPTHIGIMVRKSKENVINIGFNVDKTSNWFSGNRAASVGED